MTPYLPADSLGGQNNRACRSRAPRAIVGTPGGGRRWPRCDRSDTVSPPSAWGRLRGHCASAAPRRPGQRIKTDRRDAAKLVRLFRAGELTAIHVLDESEEAVRDLVRCRDDLRRDVLRWRHRVLKLLARHGRAYLAGKNWSHTHWRWIREQRFH